MTTNLYRATADARINGRACPIKIVAQPEGDDGLVGVIGLPEHHPEPLVGFSLQGDSLKFIDLAGDEQALRRAFGVPGVEVRGCLCRLAVEMLLGPDLRRVEPAQAQAPTGTTVH
jgi:hypothetical protein